MGEVTATYIPSTAPEHNEPMSLRAAEIRAHFRKKRNGGVGGVRKHQRMVPMTEVPEHPDYTSMMDYRRKSGGFSSEMLDKARKVGYAANGPWEVEKLPNGDLVLFHYAHPLARYHAGTMSAVPREGYGFSVTDMGAVREMFYHLIGKPKGLGYGASEKMIPNLKQSKFTPWVYTHGGFRTGYEVDDKGRVHRIEGFYEGQRVALKAGGGPARMSPYAVIARDEFGGSAMPVNGRAFPSRRYPGRKAPRA